MIRLTVNNNLVTLPADSSISIEKNSPVLNDEVGAFSYPFPVPTAKNQKLLGYPGRLERAGDLSAKNFILDENGIQILRGEIDIDEATSPETGLILQSGNTEFTKLMKKKKLSELDFGSESWLQTFSQATIQAKVDEWHQKNLQVSVADYVCCQFEVKSSTGTTISVNGQGNVSGTSKFIIPAGDFRKYFCLQFSIGWVLRKIYAAANYRVILDELSSSAFNNVCVFSKLITIYRKSMMVDGWFSAGIDGGWQIYGTPTLLVEYGPFMEALNYSEMMPDFDVLEFIESVKNLLCLSIELDDRLGTVSIFFNKDLFISSNLVDLKNSEVIGWKHTEGIKKKGFSLSFADQDDDLATEYDYDILGNVATETNKPTANESLSEKNIHVNSTNRDYRCIGVDNVFSWQQIGRLKQYEFGDLESKDEYIIKAKIPTQKIAGDIDVPEFSFAISTEDIFIDMNQLAFSFFRGQHIVNSVSYPLMSFDRYSLTGAIDFTTSLKPAYLYETVYKEFINWKTYRARECTKYLQLTLAEVVQLQWRKRYVISGIAILLNQVNFEVPYRGIVKINGFTT